MMLLYAYFLSGTQEITSNKYYFIGIPRCSNLLTESIVYHNTLYLNGVSLPLVCLFIPTLICELVLIHTVSLQNGKITKRYVSKW
jgi:hypothetical protein